MSLPNLPYNSWNETRITLHLLLQIIGKIKLYTTARKNHWWNITLHVSSEGFTSNSFPLGDGFNTLCIVIMVHQQRLEIRNSRGQQLSLPLTDGLTVAQCYNEMVNTLSQWGTELDILARPYDMEVTEPFKEITNYHHFDWVAIGKFWEMMRWTDLVFQEFSGRFYGKTCPVQIYWHHMDMAVTRFSGKSLPISEGANIADKDAYSHEVISFGFWAGDENTPEPMYYAYAHPSPPSLDKEPLSPSSASWADSNGSPMALLQYNSVRESEDPRKTLLDFLESAYQAGAKLLKWDIAALTVPPLDEM